MASPPRRPMSSIDKAEALFKAATSKPAETPKARPLPGPAEQVSLKLDRDVLDFFQEDGPGWQERINAALRKVAGLD
ncbi:MAG: BrnA antitoxin family protein [Devosia sp.]